MEKRYIDFIVDVFSIARKTFEKITTDSRNYPWARFSFISDLWNGKNKTVIFIKEGFEPVNIVIETDECPIPNEFMLAPGRIGVSISGGDRLTTDISIIEVIQGGYQKGGPPLPPQPGFEYVQTPAAPERNISTFRDVGGQLQGLRPDGWRTYSGESTGPGGDGIIIDNHTLHFVAGSLAVNTTNNMEQDNTLPITAAGVYTVVGNIEALLATL